MVFNQAVKETFTKNPSSVLSIKLKNNNVIIRKNRELPNISNMLQVAIDMHFRKNDIEFEYEESLRINNIDNVLIEIAKDKIRLSPTENNNVLNYSIEVPIQNEDYQAGIHQVCQMANESLKN